MTSALSHMDDLPRRREEPQAREAPTFAMEPVAVETGEGEPAKFLVKVGGHPRPKVNWWINGMLVASVSFVSLTFIINIFFYF